MPNRPSVSIVGCGRTGGSLALALSRAGYRIAAVWSHSREGRQRAGQLLEDVPVLTDPAETVRAGAMAIVAVPDDRIADVASDLLDGVRRGQRVVHTSGAVSVEALAPVRDAGGRIGSLHPLQTLPDPERGAEALEGAGVAVTCDPADRRYLHRLATGWGGRPFSLPDEAKPRYHAAAVFASNHVVASLWAATRLLEEAGIPKPASLIAPLARTSIEHVAASGPERSITGPVVREDAGVLAGHVEALRGHDETLIEAYRAMARLTAALTGADTAKIEKALR